jgi:hypothetical protein
MTPEEKKELELKLETIKVEMEKSGRTKFLNEEFENVVVKIEPWRRNDDSYGKH